MDEQAQINDDTLLTKINVAVAAANEAEKAKTETEKTAETAQTEFVSRSKAVGLLLHEAKKLHPGGKDFEAFLKRVDGLQLSRAYDLMRLAGGRITDEELKKDARERVNRSHRAKKKLPSQPGTEEAGTGTEVSVTDPHVTETAEASAEKRKPETGRRARSGDRLALGRVHLRLPPLAAEDVGGRSAEGASTRH